MRSLFLLVPLAYSVCLQAGGNDRIVYGAHRIPYDPPETPYAIKFEFHSGCSMRGCSALFSFSYQMWPNGPWEVAMSTTPVNSLGGAPYLKLMDGYYRIFAPDKPKNMGGSGGEVLVGRIFPDW